MKAEILLAARIYPPVLAVLEREFTVRKLSGADDGCDFIKLECANVRAAVTTGITGLSRDHIEALPKLEIIACFGTPHGTVDLASARARGVIVTNTPDSIQDLVAELAVGLAIATLRKVCETDRFIRAGKWLTAVHPMGTGLCGKTCVIRGLGRVGQIVAIRAEACRMRVRYHGPREKQGASYPYHADLESMARESDCLVVTCPETAATRGLVGARILDALGPDGYLINVARGHIVDEAALIAALKEKRIAGAGLDVYWEEPRVPAELLAMDNVVLTPHIGSSTREVREERGRELFANLR